MKITSKIRDTVQDKERNHRSEIREMELPGRVGPSKKVLLVVPPGSLSESYGRLSTAAGELPMLGLAYIAASLRDQGHRVKIVDYEVHGKTFRDFQRDLLTYVPDVVGMTAYITNMQRCAKLAEMSKRTNPDATVIMGGPQVSIFPDSGMNCSAVDLCVLSEGEIVIRNVMNALANGSGFGDIKGVVYRRKDGKVVNNGRETLVDNLDILPLPALDLYDMDAYFPPVYVRGRNVANMMTSRGCPFKCTFCETKLTFGRTFRYHSTERVINEIKQLIQRGFKSIQFYDDIFTINKRRTKELCRAIIEKGIRIQWQCFTRTDCVDNELLALMKRAGCYTISFGAETGNDELMRLLKKSLTVAQNRKGIRLAKRNGILTNSSFMLGIPTETREQSLKTIKFALTSGLDYAVFPILEPYPGTALWADAHKYGTFDSSGKYQNNLMANVSDVWIPNGRTREELEQLAHLAMRRFYLRPKQMMRALLNFYHLPLRRALRYLWAGISFFVINYFRPSKAGTRY